MRIAADWNLSDYGALARTIVRRMLLPGAVLVSACDGGTIAPETAVTYSVRRGACGDVVFHEKIANDSAAALAVIEAHKIAYYGQGAVTLEIHRIEVADRNGNAPAARFYGVWVLNTRTMRLEHSLSEVITTDGELFRLHWCPD